MSDATTLPPPGTPPGTPAAPPGTGAPGTAAPPGPPGTPPRPPSPPGPGTGIGSPSGGAPGQAPPAAPARRPVVALAAGAAATGVVLDIGTRGGPDNVVVTIGILLAVAVLLASGRISRPTTRWVAVAAALPAVGLAVRVSPWVVGLDVALVMVLVGAAASFGQSGSLFDTSPGRIASRALLTMEGILTGPALLRPLLPRATAARRRQVARVACAVLVTLPLLGAMALLLASADAVFAGLLFPDVQAGPGLGHLLLAGTFAALVLGLVAVAREDTDELHLSGPFGALEVATVLSMAVAMLGLFVVAQLVALTDAGDRLVASSGLTPAEYARSGFFQLCWATVALLGFLALVRAMATAEALAHRVVRVLGAVVPALALGLVVVSLRRMALYDEAFGLTMLRLWVVGATVWLGVVLVLVALRNLAGGRGRDWVVGGVVTAALALVLTANVTNPEAFVVRHNVERARDGAELDASYLDELSADAAPALADAIEAAPPGTERDRLLAALDCHGGDPGGVAALNLARARAEDLRDDVCPAR